MRFRPGWWPAAAVRRFTTPKLNQPAKRGRFVGRPTLLIPAVVTERWFRIAPPRKSPRRCRFTPSCASIRSRSGRWLIRPYCGVTMTRHVGRSQRFGPINGRVRVTKVTNSPSAPSRIPTPMPPMTRPYLLNASPVAAGSCRSILLTRSPASSRLNTSTSSIISAMRRVLAVMESSRSDRSSGESCSK